LGENGKLPEAFSPSSVGNELCFIDFNAAGHLNILIADA